MNFCASYTVTYAGRSYNFYRYYEFNYLMQTNTRDECIGIWYIKLKPVLYA